MPQSSLRWDAHPARAGVVVLVLHGGAVTGRQPNRPWSHNTIRLVPFARALAHVPGPIAVARLRFRYRGWNGGEASPVHDARWALDQIRSRYPGVPIVLVGHSMGGRTALTVAGTEPDVRLVVGLAPWIERGDLRPGAGQRTVLIHGDRDLICPLMASRVTVEAMQADGLVASLIRVARSDHAMLVRARVWTTLVTDTISVAFATELEIDGAPRRGPLGAAVARVVHTDGAFVDV